MAASGRRKKTLGRGMSDLIGDDLESLVRTPGPEPQKEAPPEAAGAPETAAPPGATGPESLEPASAASAPARPAAAAPPPAAPRAEPAIDGARAESPAPVAPPSPAVPDREEAARGADRPSRPAVAPPPRPRAAGRAEPSPIPSFPAGGLPGSRAVAGRVEPARSHPRIFAVASGKGGTGKSLVAVNLAVSMAGHMKVCLIDADFALGNAHILMGLMPRYNVAHLIRRERNLEQVLQEGPRGVLLLPAASGVPEMASLDDGTLDAFASTIGPVLDRCDAVVLDCPGGITRQSLLMLHGSDVVIVVTNDDLTSMTDAYALIKTLVIYRPDLMVGLVVNDALSAGEGVETYRKISHVARKFLGRQILSLGTIPRDARFERSVMERRPIVLGHPRSPGARAVEELAARLIGLQGLDRPTGFPERMHRTLAASDAGRAGEGLCMS